MTAPPISLTDLRAEAERFADQHHYDPKIPETVPPLSVISVDELLALIDAIEAARELLEQEGIDATEAARVRLREALARFQP
jgi:hypothetical protein